MTMSAYKKNIALIYGLIIKYNYTNDNLQTLKKNKVCSAN